MGMSVKPGGNDEFDDGHYQPMAEINITPMVDVMLVLLIIFMVAAPLMVAGVPIDLPNTSATRLSKTHPTAPVVITLTPNGELRVREDTVAREGLIGHLKRLRAAEGDTVVYVRASKGHAYGDVMALLGSVGQSGYQRVSLLSQPKVSEGGVVIGAPEEK